VRRKRSASQPGESVQGSVQLFGRIRFRQAESALSRDDFCFLKWGESISAPSCSPVSRCGTRSTAVSVQSSELEDVRLERQTQEVFASMEPIVVNALRQVCLCGCHALRGYDLDVFQITVEDVCVRCDCLTQR
jgi:hypothetical protein